MIDNKIHINALIAVIQRGGALKTGIDIYDRNNVLILDGTLKIDNINILEKFKKSGINFLPINEKRQGGIWNSKGENITLVNDEKDKELAESFVNFASIEKKIKEIEDIKRDATVKYQKAKGNIKKIIDEIKKSGGEFDYGVVEDTVTDLLSFLSDNQNAFTYLTKEIFSYDDYLYNHSINVCTIGMAVLNRFNNQFSALINSSIREKTKQSFPLNEAYDLFNYYSEEDILEISIGFFMHDVGKVMISDKILNKKGKLTQNEFEIVKTHSFEKGINVLEKNKLNSLSIRNNVKFHHAALYKEEARCYPEVKEPGKIPPYVKICKLADIYDAMTSRRSYKEACNPIEVVTDIFRTYAKKDPLLQLILHSFVTSIGIHPPGSIVYLTNGQMAYILESTGPIVIPFTNTEEKTLLKGLDIINLGTQEEVKIDSKRALVSLKAAYDSLPLSLKKIIL